MKINKFSLVYLAGMIMILVSGFFPFLRYRFTMENVQDIKESFPLLNLKKLAVRYSGMGEIGFMTKLLPYLIFLAGVAGIVIVVIYLKGDRDTWNIFNMSMFFPTLVSAVAFFIMKNNKTIQAIRDIMKDTTESMQETGYAGYAGYGAGCYLLAGGILISLVGAICFFALDKS